MDDIKIIKVLAQDYEFDIDDTPIVKKAFGLEELVSETLNDLPNYIRNGFVAAQKVSQYEKHLACCNIIDKFVENSLKDFWELFALSTVFATNWAIKKMLKEFAEIYNMVIDDDAIEDVVKECGYIDVKTGLWGFFCPVPTVFNTMIRNLLEENDKDYLEKQSIIIDKDKRSAKMLVYYGFTFVYSIEKCWRDETEERLSNMSVVIEQLKKYIKESMANSKK